jgi:geranylgeranyl pyrophosphate synthase
MKSNYKKELLKYYGKNKLSDSDIDKVRDIFNKSGAYEKSVSYMNELFKECINKLEKININKEYKDMLLGFVNFLELRDK